MAVINPHDLLLVQKRPLEFLLSPGFLWILSSIFGNAGN